MSPAAVDVSDVRHIGVGTLIVLAVIALLLIWFVKSLVGRVITIVIVVVLGLWVWQQKASIDHKLTKDKCQLNATFFGIHVKAPQDVVQACLKRTS